MSDPKREVTLRFLAQPGDVNFGGKVHGGTVMKWIDQAGYVCASGWSGNYCVTVYVGDVYFYSPIKIGDLVEVHAKVILTGKTSIHIKVDLRSCNPKKCKLTDAIHCLIVFVSVDDNGSPVKVQSWQPQEEADLKLEAYARKLMEVRKSVQKEVNAFKKKAQFYPTHRLPPMPTRQSLWKDFCNDCLGSYFSHVLYLSTARNNELFG